MQQDDCNFKEFTKEFRQLCEKHKVLLAGRLNILNQERYIENSHSIEYKEIIEYGLITDRTGPFLILSGQLKPNKPIIFSKGKAVIIIDKDKPLAAGVVNPLDGQKYDTRHKWDETLKQNGCHQAETSAPDNRAVKPEDMKGDFNCRKELTLATREVLEKQGRR